jgi:hypothetical protein
MLRFLVVVRKNWGGNRTERGARAQAVLTSILATAKQQSKNPMDLLVELLCSSEKEKLLNIVPPAQVPKVVMQTSAPALEVSAKTHSPAHADIPMWPELLSSPPVTRSIFSSA